MEHFDGDLPAREVDADSRRRPGHFRARRRVGQRRRFAVHREEVLRRRADVGAERERVGFAFGAADRDRRRDEARVFERVQRDPEGSLRAPRPDAEFDEIGRVLVVTRARSDTCRCRQVRRTCRRPKRRRPARSSGSSGRAPPWLRDRRRCSPDRGTRRCDMRWRPRSGSASRASRCPERFRAVARRRAARRGFPGPGRGAVPSCAGSDGETRAASALGAISRTPSSARSATRRPTPAVVPDLDTTAPTRALLPIPHPSELRQPNAHVSTRGSAV